ncbi:MULTISPECIES: low molecular weight protein-tyrosine-phosphatase [Mesonia]|uniref:Low molecular weight protein-tyrosine-phosphatase YfkJ n=1 Tax=Mesonia oceanica TaxID=2687242 RepID=A0AC61YC10_9FLAO|nr:MULTISPECIES: low molecular weight protein-tyrosine-phosphatase [Mesonia]MAN29262.1 protein-tyrosine-phosphatase [Mesonia sp.]MAQ39914.1 protein-tyrosine-phosphatase [Mesonia sp.]MBJ99048.1 protein-tyrosine-phosphatase [Flavobacteriaceae bacterium]VVV02041.1 Low molecular weight protein-tyrosine-phosphatase YfkJ [Mesonia oceanica]|tara:strand:+ start:28330 stop:28788 length:459 start_codon:yes stop_codon:yes gene_type:complete
MKTKVLMVCLGNICRSPLAEGLLKSKVNPDKVIVDSAGTSNYHVGDTPDPRSIEVAKKHGLDITHQLGRQFTQDDFETFDYIYVMDNSNYRNVILLARTKKDQEKVSLILDKIFPDEEASVPDPYHGGEHGFENVYKMLDEATNIIAKELNN